MTVPPLGDGSCFSGLAALPNLCSFLLLQIDAGDASKGSLEMTPEWFTYNRRVTLGREGTWWEVPLDTKVGLTYNGEQR